MAPANGLSRGRLHSQEDPLVVSLSNHEPPFDKLRANGLCNEPQVERLMLLHVSRLATVRSAGAEA